MRKFSKKAITLFLSVALILSMSSMAVFAEGSNAESGSLTLITQNALNANAPDFTYTDIPVVVGSETKTIAAATIQSATWSEQTLTMMKGTDPQTKTITCCNLKSLFQANQIDVSITHALKVTGSRDFTAGYSADDFDKAYLYIDGGAYRTAVDGSAGNKWVSGVESFEITSDCVWQWAQGKCTHVCGACGKAEPKIDAISGDQSVEVYDCAIKAAANVTESWTMNGSGKVNTYYNVKDILTTAGLSDIADAHGFTTLSNDGMITGYSSKNDTDNDGTSDADEVGIFVEGSSYRAALNGGTGKQWPSKVTAISVAPAAKHIPGKKINKGDTVLRIWDTCAICGEDILSVSGIKDMPYTGSAITQSDMVVKSGEETLTEGKDYSVDYSNNVNIGTATITITNLGTNNVHTETFQITKPEETKPAEDTKPAETKASDGDVATVTEGAAAGSTVKVTSAANKTVSFTKAKNGKSVTVPDTVKIGNEVFAVTSVGSNAFKGNPATSATIGKNVSTLSKNAFKGSKVKTLTVKSKKLTKKSVKGSLKGSKVKKVKVKVGNKKLNKKYVKIYKKIFTKKNAGKKVKVTK